MSVNDETPAPEDAGSPTFDSYRPMADWIANQLRAGTMWGGWNDTGRYAYGDDTTPPADDITVMDPTDEFEVGLLAGSIASQMVMLAVKDRDPDPRNRAQRRAAQRNGGARKPQLWTPN